MIADKTYHLTQDGRAVAEDDPAGVSVLVAKDGFISDEDAKKYGITGGIEAADAKAAAMHAAAEQEKKNVATIKDARTRELLQGTKRDVMVGSGDGVKAVMVTAPERGEKTSEDDSVSVTHEPSDVPSGKQDVIADTHPVAPVDKKQGSGGK